ncbi:MAG TPA: CidA/LrgA family protein [Paracoccus sp. (in: a-proteobacteria)]|nr:CidA/LrgA family protein [Paracoccus sp. (in: a-proteobacteria)]
MIPLLATILAFELIGEIASRAFDLPMPGPVIGMVLLLGAFRLWPALLDRLRPVGQGLLAHLSLFFVPAGVGIVAHLGLLRDYGVAMVVAIAVSTVLALAAGALAFTAVARLTGNAEEDEEAP